MSLYDKKDHELTPDEMKSRSLYAYQHLAWTFQDDFLNLLVASAERNDPSYALDILADCHNDLWGPDEEWDDSSRYIQQVTQLATCCVNYDTYALERLTQYCPKMYAVEEIQRDVFSCIVDACRDDSERISGFSQWAELALGKGLTPAAWVELAEGNAVTWKKFKEDHHQAALDIFTDFSSLSRNALGRHAKAFARLEKAFGVSGYGFAGHWLWNLKMTNLDENLMTVKVGVRAWLKEWDKLMEHPELKKLAKCSQEELVIQQKECKDSEVQWHESLGNLEKAKKVIANALYHIVDHDHRSGSDLKDLLPLLDSITRRLADRGLTMNDLTVSLESGYGWDDKDRVKRVINNGEFRKEVRFTLAEAFALSHCEGICQRGLEAGVNMDDLSKKWAGALNLVSHYMRSGSDKQALEDSQVLIESQQLGHIARASKVMAQGHRKELLPEPEVKPLRL